MRIFAASSKWAVPLVAAAAVLPRLVVLLGERGAILSAYTEKSEEFAKTFVASGTYGFVPGHPSAYTQPLYGFFLVPVYWLLGRNWEAVGLAQIALATLTALTVLAIGRRVAPRFAVLAAVVSTLNPYLIWHDVHVNREIVDQLVLALLVLTALLAAERRSLAWTAVAGALCGAAILANSRLLVVPVVVAVLLIATRSGRPVPIVLTLAATTALVLAPWVVRNRVEVGCFAITTDGRAFWKANDSYTYGLVAEGKWIDDVPETGFPQSAENVAKRYRRTGVWREVPECTQMHRFERLAETWIEHHPGGKARLAVQATELLWDPRAHETSGRPGAGTWRDAARRYAEPVWAIPVYLLALAGLFVASRRFAAFAAALLALNTVAAWIFAGTTRYRVPFDFLLVLLGSAALERVVSRRR